MSNDDIEQGVIEAYEAKDLSRARAGMQQLLAAQLENVIPAMESQARERLRFDGSWNKADADEVFLQFITSRAEAEQAVLALNKVKGDPLSLVEYALREERAVREAIRLAFLAADALKWLCQPSGAQFLMRKARAIKFKFFWTVELEPEDAAGEATIRLLSSLPTSLAYIERTICSVYVDAARQRGREPEFHVAINDDLDDEGANFIENLPSGRIPNGTVFSKMRRKTLLEKLKDVRDDIPGMKIKMPGKKNLLTLGLRHQQLFERWLSLAPAYRTDVELTVAEMCDQIGCSDKTLTEDFKRLQVALSQHPKYPEILELMIPIRFSGIVPPDSRAYFERAIREKREEFHELVKSWWRDLE